MANTVEIETTAFIDLLWDRVDEMRNYDSFTEKFWKECFEYLEDIGFFNPKFNAPKYIIDNIMINGEICHKDDCADNYDEINEDYNGDVEEWADNNGYPIFDDYVVVNFGL